MRIKRYIEAYGIEVTPPESSGLPSIFRPGTSGFISQIKSAYANVAEYADLLGSFSENEFQSLYGARRLRDIHKLVINYPAAYGMTDLQAHEYFKEELIDYASHRLPQWLRMFDALNAEYDPIENYDRYEETDTTHTGTDTTTHGKTDTLTMAGSETDTLAKSGSEISTPSGKTTVTDQRNVNGYNSSSSVPESDGTSETTFDQRKDTLSFDQRQDTNTKTFSNRSDTHAESGTTELEKDLSDHTESHIHGNIGVTTAAQMITQDLELRKRDLIHSFYSEIADRFLLVIY